MATLTIQLANTTTGEYDVKKPKPYPYHIDSQTFDVGRQDVWNGDPARLLGFQYTAEDQRVTLFTKEWAQDPQLALGMYPVFVKANGGIYSMTLPVESVVES